MPATVCVPLQRRLQDTPSVKASYEAAVRVPQDLTALMSAVPVQPQDDPGGSAAALAGESSRRA